MGVWIESGTRFETEANNGTAHFLEHMAFKVVCLPPRARAWLPAPWPRPTSQKHDHSRIHELAPPPPPFPPAPAREQQLLPSTIPRPPSDSNRSSAIIAVGHGKAYQGTTRARGGEYGGAPERVHFARADRVLREGRLSYCLMELYAPASGMQQNNGASHGLMLISSLMVCFVFRPGVRKGCPTGS